VLFGLTDEMEVLDHEGGQFISMRADVGEHPLHRRPKRGKLGMEPIASDLLAIPGTGNGYSAIRSFAAQARCCCTSG
jgi:hypothetical protein